MFWVWFLWSIFVVAFRPRGMPSDVHTSLKLRMLRIKKGILEGGRGAIKECILYLTITRNLEKRKKKEKKIHTVHTTGAQAQHLSGVTDPKYAINTEFKQELNASRPPLLLSTPQQRKKCQKIFMIIGCKGKTSSWHLIGFPNCSNIGPTVLLYTCINRHARIPTKTKTKDTMGLDHKPQRQN